MACSSDVSQVAGTGDALQLAGDRGGKIPAWPRSTRATGGAFVSVLWGSGDLQHARNALTLGYSLWLSKTAMECVLLVTADAFESTLIKQLEMYWSIERIQDVEVPAGLVSGASPRFHRVFNKLRAWELHRYKKICLLDTDILIAKNVDELLRLPSPTALVRGHELPGPGQLPRKHQGINAGVITIGPSGRISEDPQVGFRGLSVSWKAPAAILLRLLLSSRGDPSQVSAQHMQRSSAPGTTIRHEARVLT